MSTSSSPALEPEHSPEVKPFHYSEAPGGGMHSPQHSGSGGPGAAMAPDAMTQEAARQAGEAQARARLEAQLAQVREGVRGAVEDFARERTIYYRRVEGEVVQLALSIARKILHREAQLDPFLLAGIVRVALDQIESNTKVMVRVHPRQAAEWRELFRRDPTPQTALEIVDDPTLEPERCVLQTELGTTELGVEVQLKEIEQGLLDLMAQRPPIGA